MEISVPLLFAFGTALSLGLAAGLVAYRTPSPSATPPQAAGELPKATGPAATPSQTTGDSPQGNGKK